MSLFRYRTTLTQDQYRNLRKAGNFRSNRAYQPPACDSGVTVTTHDNDIRMLVGCDRKNAGRDKASGNVGLHRYAADKIRLSHPCQIALGQVPVYLPGGLDKIGFGR